MHLSDELQNLAAAKVIVEARVVGQIPDFLLHRCPLGLTVQTIDDGFSGRRNENSHEHANGRGFPGAVRAQEAEDFAPPDGKTKRVHGGKIAVAFTQIFESDHWEKFNLLTRTSHVHDIGKPRALNQLGVGNVDNAVGPVAGIAHGERLDISLADRR